MLASREKSSAFYLHVSYMPFLGSSSMVVLGVLFTYLHVSYLPFLGSSSMVVLGVTFTYRVLACKLLALFRVIFHGSFRCYVYYYALVCF